MSLAEMLRYGDMNYDQKNYASAIHFYKMIVDEALKVERISTYPYANAIYTAKGADKTKMTDSTAIDSLGLDSLMIEPEIEEPEIEETEEEEPEPEPEEPEEEVEED